MAVGRHGAQGVRLGFLRRVDVDAVQIEPRLLGGDGEARFVDQPLQIVGGEAELVGQGARRHLREILFRQARQLEAHRAGADRQPAAFAGEQFGLHLRAVRQLAHDVVEHVRGRGGRAVAQHVGRDGFDDLDVQIGGGELQRALGRLDHHVREDRDGVAPFDDALNMAQRLQKSAAFDVDFHGSSDCRAVPRKAPSGPLARPPEVLDSLELIKAKD